MIQWLRYVVHSEIEKYRALGWEISDDLSGDEPRKMVRADDF